MRFCRYAGCLFWCNRNYTRSLRKSWIRGGRINDISIARAVCRSRINRKPICSACRSPRQIGSCRNSDKPVCTFYACRRISRAYTKRKRTSRTTLLCYRKLLSSDCHSSRSRLVARILSNGNCNQISALAITAIHN